MDLRKLKGDHTGGANAFLGVQRPQIWGHALAADDKNAKQIKADALTNLASNMVNATARNYYLTVARELRE